MLTSIDLGAFEAIVADLLEQINQGRTADELARTRQRWQEALAHDEEQAELAGRWAACLEEAAHDPGLAELAMPLAKAFAKLQQATVLIARKGEADPEEAAAAATDYLQLFGLVALGYMWLRMAKCARDRLPAADVDTGFYDAKLKTARFYMQRMLPHANAHFLALAVGKDSLMGLAAEAF